MPARKRKSLLSLWRSKYSATVNAPGDKADSSQFKVFWPNDFLAPDIPDARVWTYGYNADTIGGLFEANNKNSILQHGRDLAARIERVIENEVITLDTP